jgi:hypothetical protein
VTHPFGDGAGRHQREPLHGAAEHLEIDDLERSSDTDPFGRVPVRSIRIAIVKQRERAFA